MFFAKLMTRLVYKTVTLLTLTLSQHVTPDIEYAYPNCTTILRDQVVRPMCLAFSKILILFKQGNSPN